MVGVVKLIRYALAVSAFVLQLMALSAPASAATKANLIKFWDDREPNSLINVDHSTFQEILEEHIMPNHVSGIARFDYNGMTEVSAAKLDQYLGYLQLLEPRQLTDPEAKAYWINLYNAATLKLVIDAVLERNITRVQARGLPARRWRRNIVTVSQQEMSLNDILNGVIRPMYKDPRVHYALFFCTLGGPNMSSDVLNGENNDALLDTLEADYLSQQRAVRVENGELVLSEMFRTYDTDFASDRFTLMAYLRERVPEAVAQAMDAVDDVRFEYDWTLNAP